MRWPGVGARRGRADPPVDLARTANAGPSSRRRRPALQRVRPGIERVVEAIAAPAWVRNGRADFMACNRLARALYAPVFDSPILDRPVRPANTARFAFLDPRARDFYVDWDRTASAIVAVLQLASKSSASAVGVCGSAV